MSDINKATAILKQDALTIDDVKAFNHIIDNATELDGDQQGDMFSALLLKVSENEALHMACFDADLV